MIAASQAFTERGYTATSLDDIANRLGSTKGRIYHHFTNKAALFIELQHWATEHLINRIKPIASRLDVEPRERLRMMAREHTLLILTGYGFESTAMLGREANLLDISTTSLHKALRRVVELRDQYEDLFATVLEEGISVGDFANVQPRLLTKPLLGALNWTLVWYKAEANRSRISIEELADFHASFAVRAVLREQPLLAMRMVKA